MYLLWPAHDNSFPSQKQTNWQSPALIIDNNSEEWLVEKILREYIIKIDKNKRHEFLIKWIGYTRSTWESASILDNIIILDHYEDCLRKTQYFNEEGNNIRN